MKRLTLQRNQLVVYDAQDDLQYVSSFAIDLCNTPRSIPGVFDFPQVAISFPLDFYPGLCQYIDMVCLYCGSKTHVTNSRPQKRSNAIWRRRECSSCKTLFTSIESIDISASLRVKHSKVLEPYEKEKLMFSLYESLKHLENASEAAKELTETITLLLAKQNSQSASRSVVQIKDIVRCAIGVMQRFDAVAGPHYQARYKRYLS